MQAHDSTMSTGFAGPAARTPQQRRPAAHLGMPSSPLPRGHLHVTPLSGAVPEFGASATSPGSPTPALNLRLDALLLRGTAAGSSMRRPAPPSATSPRSPEFRQAGASSTEACSLQSASLPSAATGTARSGSSASRHRPPSRSQAEQAHRGLHDFHVRRTDAFLRPDSRRCASRESWQSSQSQEADAPLPTRPNMASGARGAGGTTGPATSTGSKAVQLRKHSPVRARPLPAVRGDPEADGFEHVPVTWNVPIKVTFSARRHTRSALPVSVLEAEQRRQQVRSLRRGASADVRLSSGEPSPRGAARGVQALSFSMDGGSHSARPSHSREPSTVQQAEEELEAWERRLSLPAVHGNAAAGAVEAARDSHGGSSLSPVVADMDLFQDSDDDMLNTGRSGLDSSLDASADMWRRPRGSALDDDFLTLFAPTNTTVQASQQSDGDSGES